MKAINVELVAILDGNGSLVSVGFPNDESTMSISIPQGNGPLDNVWLGRDGKETFAGTGNDAAGWLLGAVVERLKKEKR